MIDEWVIEESVQANTDQQKFLHVIATRMKEEARDLMEGCVCNSEPSSLLCMGGPGVGKSYISKAMRRLFDMVKYEDTRHYQFAAYQAVVAEQLRGDTLHHFAGVGVGKSSDPSNKKPKNNLRWLIIDEISQVSADLLAQVEANLRTPMQECGGTYKVAPSGRVRDYGGINCHRSGQLASTQSHHACFPHHSMNRSLKLNTLWNCYGQASLNLLNLK